jgi:hypothetical protein
MPVFDGHESRGEWFAILTTSMWLCQGVEYVVATDVAESRCSHPGMMMSVPLGRAPAATTSAAFTSRGGFTVEWNATPDDPHGSVESRPTVKQPS